MGRFWSGEWGVLTNSIVGEVCCSSSFISWSLTISFAFGKIGALRFCFVLSVNDSWLWWWSSVCICWSFKIGLMYPGGLGARRFLVVDEQVDVWDCVSKLGSFQ